MAVLGLILTAGCDVGGGNDGGSVSHFGRPDFVVYMGADEDAGRIGLSAAGKDRTRLVIEVSDPPGSRQRAEIRTGACPPDGPWGLAVEYLLEDIVDGESETVVAAPLRALRLGGYLVFVHQGPVADNNFATCVDLTEAEPAE